MYFVTIHPVTAADLLREMTPKERWKMEYRSQRLARKVSPPITGINEPPVAFKFISSH